MARVSTENSKRSREKPATTPEAREQQIIVAAEELALEQIRSGTASSQVITHYLKLGSSRERLEQERLEHEIELSRVKREAMEGAERQEELYKNALDAMRGYQGMEPLPEDDLEDL